MTIVQVPQRKWKSVSVLRHPVIPVCLDGPISSLVLHEKGTVFDCLDVSFAIRFPLMKMVVGSSVSSASACLHNSGHEGQQVQEPDAAGCWVTLLNCKAWESSKNSPTLDRGQNYWNHRPCFWCITPLLAPGCWPIHVNLWFGVFICFPCCKKSASHPQIEESQTPSSLPRRLPKLSADTMKQVV